MPRYSWQGFVVGRGTVLHSDSEAVLTSAGMSSLLASQGMTARASPPYTHARNGIVERHIQSLFDAVRALLFQAGMRESFWPIALQHASYLRNRVPTQALGGRAPLHKLINHARYDGRALRLPRFDPDA